MTIRSKPRLAITLGDPAGIGPEVVVKALARPDIRAMIRPLVIGDRGVLERTARRLGHKLSLRSLTLSELESAPARAIDILGQEAVDPHRL
ncbi:MAG TPA: 4-phospho-D-threonate 3-dehydrogenase, partial [Nitrospiria bacterium]